MARNTTLATLRQRAQRAADMEFRNIVQVAEWQDLINYALTELFDLVLKHYGEIYFLVTTPYVINTVNGQQNYALPADFYKLMGVDAILGSGLWVTIDSFNFNERNRYNYAPAVWSTLAANDVRYQLQGSTIAMLPVPAAVTQIRLWYVSTKFCLNHDGVTPQDGLYADTDIFDGINGWDEWVVISAAIEARRKTDRDTSALDQKLARATARIQTAAANRNAGSPKRTVDIAAAGNVYTGM